MDPAVFLVALITVVGTAAVTIVKVARLWATRRESPSPDVTARLEALERVVQASNRSKQKHRSGSISQSVYSASHGKNPASAASEDSTDCAA